MKNKNDKKLILDNTAWAELYGKFRTRLINGLNSNYCLADRWRSSRSRNSKGRREVWKCTFSSSSSIPIPKRPKRCRECKVGPENRLYVLARSSQTTKQG